MEMGAFWGKGQGKRRAVAEARSTDEVKDVRDAATAGGAGARVSRPELARPGRAGMSAFTESLGG